VNKPQALLFDFGGTLDCPSHWLDRFLAHYRACGIEITREELDPAFAFATQAGYAAGKPMERFKLGDLVRFLVGNQFEYLRRDGAERVRAAIDQKDSRERFQMVERIRDSFLAETSAGLARNREILKRLKPEYKLGVISNWYGNLDAIIAEAGMARLFDGVIDSTKVRAFKPDEAIFRAALTALRVAAEKTAMVGDSMPKDCAPAHRLGMRTVLLRSRGADAVAAAQSADGIAPDFTIDSLEQLLELTW
jgi:putative hydrolase of the HAD superfamily